jgi:hypothetical protein
MPDVDDKDSAEKLAAAKKRVRKLFRSSIAVANLQNSTSNSRNRKPRKPP